MKLSVIIMAGGIGKRMKSKRVKVLHKILDKPLLWYVIELAKDVSPDRVVVVYGKNGEEIKEYFKDVDFAYQEEPLGTGDAVKRGLERLKDFNGNVLVLSGDVILLKKDTLLKMINEHILKNSDCTILTFIPNEPSNYGRIIRHNDEIVRIIEAKDATKEELQIKEVNSGVYIFNKSSLEENIMKIDNKNVQCEYYLTDVIGKIKENNGIVRGVICGDPTEVEGINTREELANIERIIRNRIVKKFQDEGVTFHLPETVYITPDVVIGKDTEIFPFNVLMGNTHLGEHCVVESYCFLNNAKIPDGTIVKRGTIIDE